MFCEDEARRAEVLKHPTLTGIDYVEVSAESLNAQRFIHVYFLQDSPPAGLAGLPTPSIRAEARITSNYLMSFQ